MNQLPPELVEMIIKFALDFDNYKSLRSVSKTFHGFIADLDPPIKKIRSFPRWLNYTPLGLLHGFDISLCRMRNNRIRVRQMINGVTVSNLTYEAHEKFMFEICDRIVLWGNGLEPIGIWYDPADIYDLTKLDCGRICQSDIPLGLQYFDPFY